MKQSTKFLSIVAMALLASSLITLWEPLGLAAAGIFVFCAIIDPKFRGRF